MEEVRFYISIFLRRLPSFLIVATAISAVSIIAALTLPPTYEAQMRLILFVLWQSLPGPNDRAA